MRPLGSGLTFLAIAGLAIAGGLTITGGIAGSAQAAPHSVISMMTHKHEHVGQCFSTHVRQVTFRLFDEAARQPVPGSGSKILFTDGHENVAYDQVPMIDASRPGDPVRLCVRSLPTGCPAGDTRDITYSVMNIRTGQRWMGADSTHACGGA